MASREIEGAVPAVEVTLLEDRAHVMRRGLIKLSAGQTRVRVEGVAPVLSHKTLTASIGAGQGVRVVDAQMTRLTLFDKAERPDDIRSLDEAIDAKRKEQNGLSSEQAVLTTEHDGLGRIAQLTVQEIVEDAAWGRTEPEAWGARLDDIRDRQASIVTEQEALTRRSEELAREVADLVLRRDVTTTPSSRVRTCVLVDVIAEADTEVELQIEYVVPSACWRPYHTVQLSDGEAPSVRLRTDACVWQNTGEDWPDVQLRLSTERPSLGSAPPLLSGDLLRTQKKSETLNVEAREEKIHTAGLGVGETVIMPDVPGIDDGGEPMSLKALARADVPSDGYPHRVPIIEFDAEAEIDLVLTAELAPAVLLRTRQVNGGPRPILPGPVDLVRDSGLVGRTSVAFVGAGEKFEIGWGPDASLRVQRKHKRLTDKQKLLSSWTTTPHRVRVLVSNIGADPKTIEVTERVPVSEIEKVKIVVEPVETSESQVPDKDGFLKWTLRVPAFGHKELELGYTVKKHQDVVGL